MELTVAITGASGTIYAHRTLQLLAASGVVETVNLIMSGTAAVVAQVEMGANLKDADTTKINEWLGLDAGSKMIRYWRLDNFAAKPSSGSNKQAGMIIVPCSMGTIGSIASGVERTLSIVRRTFALKKAASFCSSRVRRRTMLFILKTCCV